MLEVANLAENLVGAHRIDQGSLSQSLSLIKEELFNVSLDSGDGVSEATG